jgi:hypothetical protein
MRSPAMPTNRRTFLLAAIAVAAPVAVGLPCGLTKAEAKALREQGWAIDCFLNGVRMSKVLDVDADAGWMLVGVPHPVTGEYQLEPVTPRAGWHSEWRVVTATLYGRVLLVPSGEYLGPPNTSEATIHGGGHAAA